MNTNTSPCVYEDDEITINLVDLLYHMLTKWRMYILLLVIGIGLGLGLVFLPGNVPSLSDVDMENVKLSRIEEYINARNLCAEQETYMNESLLLQLDEKNTATGTLRYYITAPRADIELIGQLYGDIMGQAAVWQQINNALETNSSDRYLREIAWHSFKSDIVMDGEQILPDTVVSATLTFNTVGATEEQCQKILEVLCAHAEKQSADIAKKYSVFTWEKVSEWTECGYNNGVFTSKRNSMATKIDLANAAVTIEDKLTEDEKLYCSIVYPEGDEEETGKGLGYYVKKPAIVSLVLLFAAAACYAIQYLLDPHVRYAEDIGELLHIHLIANVEGTPKAAPKGIDAWLYRVFMSNKHPVTSKEFLLQSLQTLNANSLLLCGDSEDADSLALMQWVAGQDISIRHAGFLHSDENAQRFLENMDSVVLVVKLGKTTKQQLQRDLAICRVLKRTVVGAVTIE